MTDPVSLREGLAERLEAVPGLRAYAHVPGQLSPPAVVVGEWSCEYDETLGRGWESRARLQHVVLPGVGELTGCPVRQDRREVPLGEATGGRGLAERPVDRPGPVQLRERDGLGHLGPDPRGPHGCRLHEPGPGAFPDREERGLLGRSASGSRWSGPGGRGG